MTTIPHEHTHFSYDDTQWDTIWVAYAARDTPSELHSTQCEIITHWLFMFLVRFSRKHHDRPMYFYIFHSFNVVLVNKYNYYLNIPKCEENEKKYYTTPNNTS